MFLGPPEFNTPTGGDFTIKHTGLVNAIPYFLYVFFAPMFCYTGIF